MGGRDVPRDGDSNRRPHGHAGVVGVADVEGVGREVCGAGFALAAHSEGGGCALVELVEGRVEEDVAVGLVGGEEVEGRVAGTDDGYGPRDEV